MCDASLPVNMDNFNQVQPSIQGSKPLQDKRREKVARLHATGIKLHDAWRQTANTPMSKGAAYQRASKLRKELDFMSRVNYLRQIATENTGAKQGQNDPPGTLGQMPDITTSQGVVQVYHDVVRRYYEGSARTQEVVTALKELSAIMGIKEQAELERRAIDPTQLCQWLFEAELQGKTPAEVLEERTGGLQRLCEAVKDALRIRGVMLCSDTETAKAGPLHIRGTHNDNYTTIDEVERLSREEHGDDGSVDSECTVDGQALHDEGEGRGPDSLGPDRSPHPTSPVHPNVAHELNAMSTEEVSDEL